MHEAVDYVVFGEGEISFVELLRSIKSGKEPYDIQGVGFKNNHNIILNKKRALIKDLDTLPFPARDLMPMEKYYDKSKYEELFTLVMTARGCPYNCIYCGSKLTWGTTIRFRSAVNVLEELKEIYYKYKIKNITFADDTFTLHKKRMLEICNSIMKEKMEIQYVCYSRWILLMRIK